jgi:hypothetical protein
MACPGSGLCEETQLGDAGQGARRPAAAPIWEERLPEHPTIITIRQSSQLLDMVPPPFLRIDPSIPAAGPGAVAGGCRARLLSQTAIGNQWPWRFDGIRFGGMDRP